MGRFDEEVVLITGAGHGIGRGTARRFAREGATVVVAEIDEAAGREVADSLADLGGRGLFVATDVTRKEQVVRAVDTAVERFGRLDVLVNNAARLSPNVLLEQKTDDMLEDVLRSTLWATWWASHAAFPHLRSRGRGRIVNFYSIDAEAGAWLHADYNIGKDAVLGFTRSAAAEWARHGIRVNAVAPAAVGTVFQQLTDAVPGFAEKAASMNPMGRVGDPERDVAPVVLFLASEDSRYMTGELVHVDGGQHLPRYQSRPDDLAAFERALDVL
ncbi:MAG: Oxidoreductase [Frankiales bacterium]|nr:Oxidoreductase [Frankiales bacterium]